MTSATVGIGGCRCGCVSTARAKVRAGAGGMVIGRIPSPSDCATAPPSAVAAAAEAEFAPAVGLTAAAGGAPATAAGAGAMGLAGIAATAADRGCEPVPELAAIPPRPEPPSGAFEESTSSEEGDAVEIAGEISRTFGRVVSAGTSKRTIARPAC
jgi:hypothetical protein